MKRWTLRLCKQGELAKLNEWATKRGGKPLSSSASYRGVMASVELPDSLDIQEAFPPLDPERSLVVTSLAAIYQRVNPLNDPDDD